MLFKYLKSTHPDYNSRLCDKYELLYEGGNEFLANAHKFLIRGNSEGDRVYNERLSRCFYIGYVGSIIDYFSSCLFAYNATINQNKIKDPFYEKFFKDVDNKGTDLDQFFKKMFTEALINKRVYILIDFPKTPEEVPIENLKQQLELGLDRAYLCYFKKHQLLDWQKDEFGNYEWVKFYTQESFKENFNSPLIKRHKFYIYNKYECLVYQLDEEVNKENPKPIDELEATLIHNAPHSLPGRVPMKELKVTDGLWVMNKLASIQTELFNLDNALAWQEYQGHFSMPVIKLENPEDEFKQKFGSGYWIRLGANDDFSWTEPEGKMMEVGLKRRESLKDELYRVVHQMSLSVQQTKSQTRQSGSSKQEDRYATETILKSFGDLIRESMQNVLDLVSTARGDDIEWDVSGFSNFDIESMTEKLAQLLQLQAINIHSETFKKESEKRLVSLYLEDANTETKDKIISEIEKYDFTELVNNDPLLNTMKNNFNSKPQGSTQFNQRGQIPNNTDKTDPTNKK